MHDGGPDGNIPVRDCAIITEARKSVIGQGICWGQSLQERIKFAPSVRLIPTCGVTYPKRDSPLVQQHMHAHHWSRSRRIHTAIRSNGGGALDFLQDHSRAKGFQVGNDELLVWRGSGCGQELLELGETHGG